MSNKIGIVSGKSIIIFVITAMVYTVIYALGTYDKYSAFNFLDFNVMLFYLPIIIVFILNNFFKRAAINDKNIIDKIKHIINLLLVFYFLSFGFFVLSILFIVCSLPVTDQL